MCESVGCVTIVALATLETLATSIILVLGIIKKLFLSKSMSDILRGVGVLLQGFYQAQARFPL